MAKKSTKAPVKVDINAAMKSIKKHFKSARQKAVDAPDSSMPEFEDGRYVARLMSATVGKSQASGRYQVDMAWKFVEPPYAGQTKHAYQGLETDQNVEYFLRDLKRLGFDITELDETDIPDLLEQISSTKPHLLCQIALKTKSDYQNIFINALLEDEEDGEEAEQHEDEEEADTKKKVKKAKAKKDADEEEEDDDEDEDEEEEEDEEDEDEEEEAEPEPKKKKAQAQVQAKAMAKAKAKKDDDDEDEDEEEEEDEEDEDEEEQLHISVGSEVIVQTKEGEVQGTITEIFPDEEKIRVTTADGKKLRLPADRVVSVVEKTVVAAKKSKKR
jgi:hypothetical protein